MKRLLMVGIVVGVLVATATASAQALYLTRVQAVKSTAITSQDWLGEAPSSVQCRRRDARWFVCSLIARGPLAGEIESASCVQRCDVVTRMYGLSVRLINADTVLVRSWRHHWGFRSQITYRPTGRRHGVVSGRG